MQAPVTIFRMDTSVQVEFNNLQQIYLHVRIHMQIGNIPVFVPFSLVEIVFAAFRNYNAIENAIPSRALV